MNEDLEIEQHIYDTNYANGLKFGMNKMYEWINVALFANDIPGDLREKIIKTISNLRAE